MNTKITIPENKKAAEEYLNDLAMSTSGKLGLMTLEDYNALLAIESSNWRIEYDKCNIDHGVGRVKLIAITSSSIDLLDQSRVRVLMERHAWLTEGRAKAIIRAIKRQRFGMDPSVQDFVLHYWRYGEMAYLMRNRKEFGRWVNTRSKSKTFSDDRVEAMFNLIPIVARVLCVNETQSNHNRKVK